MEPSLSHAFADTSDGDNDDDDDDDDDDEEEEEDEELAFVASVVDMSGNRRRSCPVCVPVARNGLYSEDRTGRGTALPAATSLSRAPTIILSSCS